MNEMPMHGSAMHGSVRTDAFTMHYFRFGCGEKPLVILPGLSVQSVMDSAQAVAEEYAVMADDFTVWLFDRREDLLVGRLALGSTAPEADTAESGVLEKWIALARSGDAVGLYLAFGRAIYPEPVFEQYRSILAEAGKTVTEKELARFVILAGGTSGFDVTDRLPEIKCPVFAIGSADDKVLGAASLRKITEKLGDRPDFTSYIYDGYGHAAFDTAPDYRERLYHFFAD